MDINNDDLVGGVKEALGNGFRNMFASNLLYVLAPLLDVLEVQRSDNHDSRGQHFFHIYPALGVLTAGGIVISDPVHKTDLRASAQDGFHIHCLTVPDFLEGNHFQGLHKVLELGDRVR